MLFDTPGLTIKAQTAGSLESSSSKSDPKKRKRSTDASASSNNNAESAGVNLNKLMKRMRTLGGDKGWGGDLGEGGKTGIERAEKDAEGKKKKDANKAKKQENKPSTPTKATEGKGKGVEQPKPNRFVPEKKAKIKKIKVVEEPYYPASGPNRTWTVNNTATATVEVASTSSSSNQIAGAPTNQDDEEEDEIVSTIPQTAMQKALRAKLAGGKFRLLNEKLYTSTGAEARETMAEEGAFDDYHAGFRSQSANWPIHPLTLLTKSLSTLPPHSLIVDFGAGDAQLARTLSTPPLTLKVISFDLVSKDGWVIVAECSSVPLPGQGGKEGGAEIVDAVVCCLSLMGTDWVKMIREARRILKTGGQLKIAEVSSRFTDLDGFVNLIKTIGFKLVRKDTTNTHFVMFDFTKIAESEEETKKDRNDSNQSSLALLKPCIYKKR